MKTKFGYIALAGVLAAGSIFSITGCSGGDPGDKMYGFGDKYYRSVASRYTLNYDEMIYDDFTGDTIDKSKWVISDSVWDQWGTDQNGVRPQNVYLVKDKDNPETHLLMQANGSYYDGDNKPISSKQNGINTGASISTVEALGPGRYDVKMKACPRIGALTSMWLFSWFNLDDGSVQQNEIDIELGLSPNFSKSYFTTWTSPSTQTHGDVDTKNNENGITDFYVNDGDWHIYSFDWVTNSKKPFIDDRGNEFYTYVDFYIDGQYLYTSTTNVPTTNATLTLGIWVPSWAGGGVCDSIYNTAPESRMFETDYAEFSWWRYVPFQMDGWEQRPVENRNYDPNYQPKVIDKVPVANKCSNGTFERDEESYWYPALRDNQEAKDTILANLKRDVYDFPWKDFTPDESYGIPGKVSIDSDGENHYAKIEGAGSYGQWLRGAHDGFRYRLTGKYKVEPGTTARILIGYFESYAISADIIDEASFTLGTATEWTDFSLDITLDCEEAVSIIYYLENLNQTGTSYFDDIELIYLGH